MVSYWGMALLEVKNLRYNYSDKELYRDVSFKINPGEHCVLVGRNGSGKTTLLNLLIGELHPDAGEIDWEPNVTYSFLDQHLKVRQDVPVLEYLYGVYQDLYRKEKEMESLYEKAASDMDNYERYLAAAERLQDELKEKGFYALQEKVGRLTDGLGMTAELLAKPLSKLSSGQREKAYLAKMLLEEKSVLLMDEPTNFLDAHQVDWLANYLTTYPKAFLVVSHDQAFCERIATVVFILANQMITRYPGSYAHFKEQYAVDMEQYEKNYNAQQRYIKKEETFIAKHIVRATSAKAAKSRRARLAHLERLEPPARDTGNVLFSFPFTHDVGELPLKVEELEIGYGEPLLEPISFVLKRGEKIAILGQNGVGKTTFVKTILRLIPSLGGSFEFLPGTEINYFSQDESLNPNATPFDLMRLAYPGLNNTEVRTVLGNVGIRQELALRKISELSGGEVTKTRFALMGRKKSNFLVLDEPTNHLDQKAKDALFKAIHEFPGAVILISHEKDFYDGLVDYELYF